MRAVYLLAVLLAVVAADTNAAQRIVGGTYTTINSYPFAASVLHSPNLSVYSQYAGGAIINNRSILTVAHTVFGRPANQYRVRYGSTWANSGGTVNNVGQIIIHPSYNSWYLTNDIAILRTAANIVFVTNTVAPASIGSYLIADNQPVSAIGWGRLAYNGALSEQLRTVQIWTINQATCRTRYAGLGWAIYDSMLCAGYLNVGGRGQCINDEGGPLVHNNNTIVGVYAFGYQCGNYYYPPVNTRVSTYVSWITTNA